MYPSTADVIGGFNKIIEEQKAIKDGKVTVSLFTFNEKVTEEYLGVDINDIKEFNYSAGGSTAMNDGIGVGVYNVGRWLHEKDVNGEEMPGKTLVVVMTDGMENASKEYTLKQIQDTIKEQTEKYSWDFVYLGNDLSDAKDANDIGIKYKGFTSKKKFYNNYDVISTGLTAYRCAANISEASLALDKSITESMSTLNAEYKADTGIDLTSESNKGSV
jgi:uncharacterized protein YegL